MTSDIVAGDLTAFDAVAIMYMERRRGVYSPYTWRNLTRRYSRIARDLEDLQRKGVVKGSIDPRILTSEDLREYILYRRNLGYTSKEYSHDESAIRSLLKAYKNDALDTCLIEYPLLKSVKHSVRLPPLPDGLYERILSNSKIVQHYDHLRAYSLVLLCIKCSCRTKEIRLAKLSDLDTDRWILHIAHPKGEGRYGETRDVAVHPDIRPILTAYLVELQNRKRISLNLSASPALFPSQQSSDGYLSENSLRRIKKIVELDINETFDFRACRRTFGQQLIDGGIDIETVSVLMGHRTTRTTETSYARRKNTQANERLVRSWS